MTDKPVFIDTNILLYAYDSQAEQKYEKAKELIKAVWLWPVLPYISIQVLQEFYVNFERKGFGPGKVKDIVVDFLEWNVMINDESVFLLAIEFQEKYQLSFWDSLIIAAANMAHVSELWSEDLSEGQCYGKVKVVNPLHDL